MDEELGRKLFNILTDEYKDKVKIDKDLKDYLNDKTKNELLFIYILYTYASDYKEENDSDIARLKKMKKAELVDEVLETIDKNLTSVFQFFDGSKINEIKKIASADEFNSFISFENNNFSIDAIRNLNELGLLFCKKEDDMILIHMPNFVKSRIKNIPSQYDSNVYSNVKFYTNALLCVYGAINIVEAYEIIKEKIKFDYERYCSAIKFIGLMELEPFYYSYECNAIYDINIEEEELEKLIFSDRKIIKYDLKFYEDMLNNKYLFSLREYKEFRNYLKEYYQFDINEDDMLREEIINDYAGISQLNVERAEELLEASLEREFEADDVEKKTIIAYIRNISRKMPQWKFGGLINAEDAKHKIGRNEPCPCGSGLKYKRCCGK